ncbi:MAG TPA: flagellar basal-body rod protein FlgF [Micrococcaceae bacterium]|nr:flagellar basal-body rod protein FlgF [Micrococcaceae bacterium]
MLRSLYSGISGLRAHQTMLDVTGNNIANVNTQGFKASSVEFQDTLSQMTKGASAPTSGSGGSNPAQVGLGVQVAGISTNFTQGSSEATGKATDMMISGDGFFVVQQGGETLYTRAGSLGQDAQGRLVTPDGAILQGWTADANGVVSTGGPVGNMTLSSQILAPAQATTTATVSGNLPSDAATGTALTRDIQVYGASGNTSTISLTFTSSGPGAWSVTDGAGDTASLTFGADGKLTSAGNTLTSAGVAVDLSTLTGFSGLSTVTAKSDNGRAAGTLESFTLSKDGTVVGSFSNGAKQAVGQIALANFTNPGGLEKAGSSSYRASANSGAATMGVAGSAGMGTLVAGSLEMSNVDLSQEFTNLIVAQRGFQANARVITTSDTVLQELIDLKR